MSILRRLSNPFAGWASGQPRRDDLLPRIKDDVFIWQLGSSDFTRLDEGTFLRADLCGKNYASKLLKACHKSGIINQATGHPDTTKIDRKLVDSLAVIPVVKQRELVMLLFFWEEESTRWRLLSAVETDIKEKLKEDGLSEGFKVELWETLRMVQERKRVVPSLRDQSGQVTQREDEQLPSYDEARRQSYA